MKTQPVRTVLMLVVLLAHSSNKAESGGNTFQEKVWEKIIELKSRGPSKREKFIEIDIKKIKFSHKRHQELIRGLGKPCKTCHHWQKKGRKPRACKWCHYRKEVISKGKYTQAGQKVKLKDAYHLLCNNCHKEMLKNDYIRQDGSRAKIPEKCHHCHERKK